MSLWSDILGSIKGIPSDIGGLVHGFVGSVASAGTNIAAQQEAGIQAPQSVQALQNKAQQALSKAGLQSAPQASSDLLLAASKPVGEAISLGVTRPVSTLGLLTDVNSHCIKMVFNYLMSKRLTTVLPKYHHFRL